jgi:hypothetical protein
MGLGERYVWQRLSRREVQKSGIVLPLVPERSRQMVKPTGTLGVAPVDDFRLRGVGIFLAMGQTVIYLFLDVTAVDGSKDVKSLLSFFRHLDKGAP